MKHIAILASGNGTNAENIIRYFSNDKNAKVTLVLSNKPQAKVLDRAAALGVDAFFFDRTQFYETGEVLMMLRRREGPLRAGEPRIDIVVLTPRRNTARGQAVPGAWPTCR